jgi:dolichol-phosphate mannosyltransferase
MAQIWVALPTYNESGNIRVVTERILAQPLDIGIVIVDDNSPDGTGDIADELHNACPDRITVIHRQRAQGRGTACFEGFKRCLALGAKWIIEMDADLSHNPDAIPRMVQAGIDNDCDLVVGSRYMPGGFDTDRGFKRRFISWGANNYLRLVLGLRLHDCSSGFKCYRRSVMEHLDLDSLHAIGPESGPESLYWIKELGFRICEVPITFIDRKVGESKLMNVRTMVTSLIFPLRTRLNIW